MTCKERMKMWACSIAADHPHDVHMYISGDGVVLARWRMVAEELPLADAVPLKGNDLYDEVL